MQTFYSSVEYILYYYVLHVEFMFLKKENATECDVISRQSQQLKKFCVLKKTAALVKFEAVL